MKESIHVQFQASGGSALQLQVVICAYGAEGIRRVASLAHPRVEGVQYVVSWQTAGADDSLADGLRKRKDFVVSASDTHGLSRNRNLAFEAALKCGDAPVMLISDDDLEYTPEGLEKVIRAFRERPDCQLLTFRYESAGYPKTYPDTEFDLSRPAKGYYPTSFEIAVRRCVVEMGVRFNEDFGVNGLFPAGEEEIFIHDILKQGYRGCFLPLAVVRHDGDTTTERISATPAFIRGKGAVFMHTHPLSWPARMLIHAVRATHSPDSLSPLAYIRAWLSGVMASMKR